MKDKLVKLLRKRCDLDLDGVTHSLGESRLAAILAILIEAQTAATKKKIADALDAMEREP